MDQKMWKSNTFSYFALTLALPIALAGCDKGTATAATAQAAVPKETVAVVSMTNPTDPKEQVFGLPRRNSENITYPTSLDYNSQFHIGMLLTSICIGAKNIWARMQHLRVPCSILIAMKMMVSRSRIFSITSSQNSMPIWTKPKNWATSR